MLAVLRPRERVWGGTKIFVSALLQPARSVRVSLSAFWARRDSIERNSYGNVAGWLGGWLSVTAGIVSKRLNLSENFLDHLVAPSFKHLGPLTPIPNSKGNLFIGALNRVRVRIRVRV